MGFPALFFFLLVCSSATLAHDLWIERSGPLHTLAYGHERSGHEGAKALEYKPEIVKQAACFAADGREIAAERGHAYPVTLQGDCAASGFHVSSGYWSKTPYGTKNLPKSEVSAVLDSWQSVENIKRIDRWGNGLGRPLSRHLELVPDDNPLKLKVGDKLRLTAWFQGKPATGVTVAYFGKPRGVSDAQGRINIRLQNPGFQLIQASLELPLNDSKADRTVHAGSLQFELP